MTIVFLQLPAYAAGGDMIWEYGDTPQTGKQEATAMAVDSAGNTVVIGYSDQSGTGEYYTVKIKSDGSGILWSAIYDVPAGDDPATDVIFDSDENVIVTGYIWNGANYDFHTIKYDGTNGDVLWQHTFNAELNGNDYAPAVALDSLNNVYIAGISQGSSAKDDYILIKYGPNGPNPDGTPIWQVSYNGAADGHDRVTSIAAGIDGVAVTGYSQNSTPDFDCLTIKYGLDGSFIWEKRYSVSGNDEGKIVRMDPSGNVIMTGATYNGSNKDIYTVKYDGSTGTVLWEDTYDGGYDEEPADLFVDSSNDVYITGYTYVLTSANDFYTAKYDGSSGTLQWSDTYNSANGNNDRAVSIAVDESGDLFVAGDSYDETLTNYNFQTLKYTKNSGTLLWQKTYNGSAGKDDRVVGIDITSSGELIVAGWSDMWTSGASDYDYYAIKYDPGLLNPPTGLNATAISTTQIDLSWSDNSSNEDGFKIERKIGDFGTYSEITTVDPNVTTYSNTVLTPDTKYYYRVRAYNAADGDSYYTDEAYAVTTIVSFTAPSLTYIYSGPDGGDDSVTALATGSDNAPVVTGYSYSLSGQFDYYTLKLNKDTLGVTWDVRYNSDQDNMDIAETIAVDSSDDVIVSGYSNLFSVASGGNSNDIYTIKYPSTGPPEDWNDPYNGPAADDDRSSVVAVSKDGSDNYVVVGYGRNADWNDDIYVIKYLSDGTQDWVATPYDGGVFGHEYPSAAAFDASGNIIITGHTYNGTDYDFFTRKHSGSDGSVIWTDIYNIAATGNDFTRSLALDSSGNVYVTGIAVTASGNEDFYTIKYDGTNGSILWEKAYNGLADGTDEAMAVKVDPVSGDVVVAGTALAGADNNEFHVIRYDSQGNVVWERTLDRPASNDFVTAMTMDLSGNVHIIGETNSGADTDVIAIMYNDEGSFMDGTEYSGGAGDDDGAAAVTVNTIGETFVGGYTYNAGGDADYLVFKIGGDDLLVPTPFNAVSTDYTRIELTWTDNSTSEDGYRLERKIGNCSSGNPWGLIYDAAADTTAFSDTGLNLGSDYCYRIRTYNSSGRTSRWVEKAATTLSPQAPGDLSSTNNTTDIDLSWTDNTINETGFTIERCTGAGCDFSSKTEFSVGPGVVAYLDNTACKSTTYRYRVNSYKTSEWVTEYSNTITVITSSISDPTDLSATRISETQIDLSWTDNTDAETGFKIERCSGGSCSDFAPLDTVGTNIIAYNDTGLSAETPYTYRIKAYKDADCPWETGYSDTSSASTTILSPSDLSALTADTTQIDLLWTDNTASESGFQIQRCEGAGCGGFDDLDTAGADATSYSDTSVCENITYNYRVKAYKDAAWSSGYSNEASAPTNAKAAPTVLTITSVSESQASLKWTDNSDDETGFELQRCTGAAASCTLDVDFTFSTNVFPSADALSYWNFDEGSGITANDYTGDNDGTVNSAEWTTGKFGSGLSFSSGKYVSVGDPADGSLDFGTGSFTLEAWIKAPTITGRHYIISKDGDTNDPLWYLELGNGSSNVALAGRLGFYLWENDNLRSYGRMTSATTRIDDDLWHHITAVIDRSAGKTRFYVDGVEQVTEKSISKGSYPGIFASNNDAFVIGRTIRSGGYFNGIIDDVAVHNRVLTDPEILEHYQDGIEVTSKYTDTGLTPETAYTYRVRSYKNATCGWQSGYTNSEETTTTAPGVPTDFTADVISSTQIDLSWTDNTDEEILFKIQRCTGAGCDFSTTDDFTVSAGVTSYSDTLLCENTVYRYRVRAERDSAPVWQSDWTATGDVTTDANIAPTGFTATTATETQIDLAWTANTVDETGYKIERCTGSGCADFTNIATLTDISDTSLLLFMHMDESLWDGSADEVVDSSTYGNHGTSKNGAITVAAGKYGRAGSFDGSDDYVSTPLNIDQGGSKAYSFEAWVYPTRASSGRHYVISTDNNGYDWSLLREGGTWYVFTGSGSWSTGKTVDVNQWQHIVAVFEPGTGVKFYKNGGTPSSTGTISFDGSDGNVNIGRRSGGGGLFAGLIDEAAVFGRALTDAEVLSHYNNGIRALTEYSDIGLTLGLVYRYRIYAYKDASCAWPVIYSAIDEDTTLPPAPSDFTVNAVNTTQINLGWTDNTSGETGFKVERCTGAGCSDFSEIGTVGVDATSYSDVTVCENVTYNYQVRGYKSGEWNTEYSPEASDTTPAKVAPSVLTATRVSEIQTTLTWTDNTSDETGFKIERCAGAACGDFTEIASVGSNDNNYNDSGLAINTTYKYRVSAYKTAACPWTSGYSNSSTATTTVSDPDNLTATPVNTTRIDLAWNDNTSSETLFSIERCTGSGCSDFAEIDTVNANVSTYSDTSVCNSTEYSYRVIARKTSSFSNDGGGCWTRRVPLTITNFESDYVTQIDITYDADMQTDFSDIRFYDATAQVELFYWIESKTDGVSATVYFKTLGNDNVYMYYGNASAASSGNESALYEYYHDFPGTVIDTSEWVEIDPNESFTQNDNLNINDAGSDGWTKALISTQTFIREENKEIYVDLTIGANTAGNNHFMIGWEKDQTSNPSYTQLVHGLYWNNTGLTTYEYGNNTGGGGSYGWNINYQMKVVLKSVGARYYIKGGAFGDWTLVRETSTHSDATMRLAFTQHSHQANIHMIRVQKSVSTYPSAAPGSEEQSACYTFGNAWDTGYTNTDSAATLTLGPPTVLLTTAVTDTQADLSWTDNSVDETGFKIERCTGAGCGDFAPLYTTSADSETYSDTTLDPETTYCYKVRAYKTATCGWDTIYTNESCDLTFSAKPTTLIATAINSFMIQLDWVDNALDEEGYELEVQVFNGKFVTIATLGAGVTTFTDTMSIEPEKEYIYRVRAFRGVDNSPYSNEAVVTTPAWQDGDDTCVE